MKSRTKSLLALLISVLAAPVLLVAQGLSNSAQVVSEEPDGASYTRAGAAYSVAVGSLLTEGDVLKTGQATVILSLANGSLMTVYPNSELQIVSLRGGLANIKLAYGEILGDTTASARISVATMAGTATITNGVYGVLLSQLGGQGWALQVRNLDGQVSFVGAPSLDTSNLVVSLVEAGKPVDIKPGEEIILRGIYNPQTDVFAVVTGGAVMAVLSDMLIGQLRDASQEMAAAALEAPAPVQAPVIIEIPYEDIETASDKG